MLMETEEGQDTFLMIIVTVLKCKNAYQAYESECSSDIRMFILVKNHLK